MMVRFRSKNSMSSLAIVALLGSACVGETPPKALVEMTTEPEPSSGDAPIPTTGPDLPGEPPADSSDTGENDASSSTSTGEPDLDISSSTGDPGPMCGDGVVDDGEACDHGFGNNTLFGACLPECTLARCGDGFVHAEAEDCDLGDAGNSFEYGGCNPVTCKWGPRCGDGQVDAPNEVCDPGDPNGQGDGVVACDGTCRFLGRIVFLSSTTFDGDLGGLAGADKQCRELAGKFDEVHADTYRAWLSDGDGSPATRFAHGPEFDGIPYVLRNGVQVAADFTALTTDGPLPGIHLTDEGEVLFIQLVWTNTGVDGNRLSAVDHCNGWTSSDAGMSARFGMNWLPAMSPDLETWQQFGQWTNAKGGGCSKNLRLYCFEN